jgi:hypothetical protein
VKFNCFINYNIIALKLCKKIFWPFKRNIGGVKSTAGKFCSKI